LDYVTTVRHLLGHVSSKETWRDNYEW